MYLKATAYFQKIKCVCFCVCMYVCFLEAKLKQVIYASTQYKHNLLKQVKEKKDYREEIK